MSLGNILFEHSVSNRKEIRVIESINRKLINGKAALSFNEHCHNNNLLPSYTNIHLNNKAVQQHQFTLEFRRNLVINEITENKRVVKALEEQLASHESKYHNLDIDPDLRYRTDEALSEQLDLYARKQESRIQKKLCHLYGGWVPLVKPKEGYVNLSTSNLSEDQKDLLNLGISYIFAPKYSTQAKKAELELLYQDICKLKSQCKIEVNPDIQDQLRAESTKHRAGSGRSSLDPRLRRAAAELRNNDSIVIRKADKSQMFVILDSVDYHQKTADILQDQTKFQKISKNPTDRLKKSANDLISASNKASKTYKFDKIIGEYQVGYFYGNVKTHKPGNPLCPIISQIPLPTYKLAKTLNNIISPFIPVTYSLKSSAEFIDLIKTRTRQGALASLDVCSLFTNVPVERTINIITNYIYHNNVLPAPDIPEAVMRAMLRLCTTKAPFRCPQGQLYYQTDGIAMGSPLGVLFAQAFMAAVEEEVLQDSSVKPTLYCRYVDDIFVEARDMPSLQRLKARLEEVSGLRFTVEDSRANKISFLDVTIDATDGNFITSVYRKPTNNERCLNGKSECPQRYKDGVVRAYVHRALKHCSNWPLVHQEIQRIKQILVDNNYDLATIDRQIQAILNNQVTNTTQNTSDRGNTISLYYKSQMTTNYRAEESALKNIIKRNCKPVHPEDKIKMTIYYQSPTTASLIVKNNMANDRSPLKQSNLVYHFKCNKGDCALLPTSGYIGYTSTTLSRRLTMHLQSGGPQQHTQTEHETRLTRQDIVANTSILAKATDWRRLVALEAIMIREMDPAINRQINARGTLQLYEGRRLT